MPLCHSIINFEAPQLVRFKGFAKMQHFSATWRVQIFEVPWKFISSFRYTLDILSWQKKPRHPLHINILRYYWVKASEWFNHTQIEGNELRSPQLNGVRNVFIIRTCGETDIGRLKGHQNIHFVPRARPLRLYIPAATPYNIPSMRRISFGSRWCMLIRFSWNIDDP